MLIYKATNTVNFKEYIGQTTQSLSRRMAQHNNSATKNKSNTYFHRAIRKYGKNSFDWEILHECSDINTLNKLEQYYIKLYNTFEGRGYNLVAGGNNFKRTEEDLIKIRKNILRAGKFSKIWHVSEEGHLWHVEHAKNIKHIPHIKKICRECGKAFLAKTISALYCHNNCKAVYNRRRRKLRNGTDKPKVKQRQ